MYEVISDLKLLDRFDLTIDTDYSITVSGYQGSWVTLDGTSGKAKLTSTAMASGGDPLSWPVWNEENRDGTQGYTPDVGETGKITVISGPHRAITDRYDHGTTFSVGDVLVATVGTDVGGTNSYGQLDKYTGTNNAVIKAVVIKAPYSYKPVGGSARNCLMIQVL